MEKTKLLTIAVIGLLVINFGTLGFLLLGPKGHRPPHEGGPQPKEIITRKLHFDANQQKEYAKLIQWHHGQIEKLDGNIREAKNKLYSQLGNTETNIKAKDSLIAVINSNQKQIEETHFKHFEDIKKICHKDQMDDFNALTEELSRIFAPKPHGPGHD
ncbi:MAG TPA: hypothetical protein PKN96_00430 [Flavobacterium sp.]|uniref:periplasmic heavy metal sensor n=1 Tax=Flavobacterium sp. TaxID=239 RepID=UPI002BE6C332|nr:hypothetical protein [Flavobacterium sp.]HNP31736.1 hypothetical protein [Flavobacterium sp.]